MWKGMPKSAVRAILGGSAVPRLEPRLSDAEHTAMDAGFRT